MPYLRIETNVELDDAKIDHLLSAASKAIAAELGKPERYVMVQVTGGAALMFDASREPAAYVELKSIGLPEGQTQPLSRFLCAFLEKELGIAPDRIYIEFIDIPRKFWGWNGGTF
ncbi:phenylpyruvate tautomerase [Methylomarinovum tepidoasis]|uniref:L-dopachrome isomerase n=1 Tax=Methylomarinovum tepidoasis TaxID=2840183 RepID=A0AAU9C989_9GAMM|nr:phenylpyruvate tautomerase MIF-related protein [Methylomarinovum sp. IN45]BCX88421.1 phenylpyruvate tautomerase [Methylomarinovum sp. IN45]